MSNHLHLYRHRAGGGRATNQLVAIQLCDVGRLARGRAALPHRRARSRCYSVAMIDRRRYRFILLTVLALMLLCRRDPVRAVALMIGGLLIASNALFCLYSVVAGTGPGVPPTRRAPTP